MRIRTIIVAVIVLLIGLALFSYTVQRQSSSVPRTLNLREFGVALEIPGTLKDLKYVPHDESAKGPGTVLHMVTGHGCDLAALYQIQKNAIQKSNTTWTEKTLKQFEAPQGTKPAQVKEFTDFYLVMEPNPDTCAKEEAEKKSEQQQQRDLLNALTTAHYMK